MTLGRVGRDIYDRVFVPDVRNNQVYVVSGGEEKVYCLSDKKHGIKAPTVVGVDWYGRIWIGCGDGTVHVIEL